MTLPPRFRVLMLVFLSCALLPGLAVAQGRRGARQVDGEILIKMRNNLQQPDLSQIHAEAEVDASTSDEVLSRRGGYQIRRLRSRSRDTSALLARLRRNKNVLYAEPNYLLELDATPNDPAFNQLWGLLNTEQYIFGLRGTRNSDTHAVTAWDVTTDSRSIVIGILDTGVDYTHPDLAANMWHNPGGIGGCPAGTVGFNAITGTCDPQDDYYHGTHVAGTAAASGNNGVGVTGVSWTASLMALKFISSSGTGTVADLIKAIEFAIQARVAGVNLRVITASWNLTEYSQALLDAINEAGNYDILFVAAAANTSSNDDVIPSYPVSFYAPNVISVAATDNRDQLAQFSNYGPTSVDLGAPGVAIYSTMPFGTYGYLSGTSMSVPFVAGAAALVLSRSNLTTQQLKQQLVSTVDQVPDLQGKTVSGGRLNIYKALTTSTTPAPPVPLLVQTPTDPTNLSVAQIAFSSTATGISFECSLSSSGGASYSACVSPFVSLPLADGRYTFAVRALDGTTAGPAATYAFTVDTVPPVVVISQRPADTIYQNSAQFVFGAADAVRYDCSFAASGQPDSFQTCVSPKTYGSLAPGTFVFKVRATDGAGNLGLPVSASFTYDNTPPPAPPNTFVENFTDSVLNPRWTWIDPVGNATWSLTASPGHLRMSLPAGTTHNCWPALFSCVRLLTPLASGNFTAETKIDGVNLGARAQGYGIFLSQDPNNYIRFEFWSYGWGVSVAAWRVSNGSGLQPLPLSFVTLGASNLLRVSKVGSTYQLSYSTNGGNTWLSSGSFSASGFVPNAVGMEANSYEFLPSTTANFDYFSLTGQN